MKLVLLIPIAPQQTPKTYIEIKERFESTGLSLIYGLNKDDAIGIRVFQQANVVTIPAERPFPICRLWSDMALCAFRQHKADLCLLLGDDVYIRSSQSMIQDIIDLYKKGFNCISVREANHPGWPTFIAAGRAYFPLPDGFVNQDADPFIFECARRRGRSAHTQDVHLVNVMGGVEHGLLSFTPPRYDRTSYDWRSLEQSHLRFQATKTTLDIAVPMLRANDTFVGRLLDLHVPDEFDVRICVCIDCGRKAISTITWSKLRSLELNYPRLRIRVNENNMGASATRTRLLKESHSDYVLFLDDDVAPNDDIITEYAKAIRSYPMAHGFVGMSRLPSDGRLWTDGVHVSTTFFWHISEWASLHKRTVPWGVTANLLLKWNPSMAFDEDFPRSGGGEDIDLCIKLGASLVPVPQAIVQHPWRPTYLKMLKRLVEWAYGDVLLITKHPKFAYRSWPNAPEIFVILWCINGSISQNICCCMLGAWLGDLIWYFVLCKQNGRFQPPAQLRPISVRSILVALHATISRNASELGHLVGQLTRGRVHLMCTRFDWFLGTFVDGRAYQRRYDLTCSLAILFIYTCILK